MIATFTDFGVTGPYLGQVRAVLAGLAPTVPVVDVFPDLPVFNVQASAYLLPAYSRFLPATCTCLCVVDPGVGGARRVLAAQVGERWYVGPDNGLLSQVVRQAPQARVFEVIWRPAYLSDSFHGRDLFAPVCAMLANGQGLPAHVEVPPGELANDWPDDLWQVIYVDGYGNCITGVRAANVDRDATLLINGLECRRQRTFSDRPPGTLFWYENSNGLIEIALTEGSASGQLGISLGVGLSVSVD